MSASRCVGETGPVSASSAWQGRRVAVVAFSHYPSDPRPRREAETLRQMGMNVEVICLKQKADDLSSETFNGVHIRRVPLQRRRGSRLAYVFQYVAFIAAGFFLLAFRSMTRRFDLVHVHNMPDVLVFSALVPKLRGAKVILDLHDLMPELMMTIFGLQRESVAVNLLKRLERLSIGRADAVVTANESCRKIVSSRSCAAAKVRMVMNSPDERIFRYRAATQATSARRNPAAPFVLMYHGSLVERHGLDLAVAAVDALRATIPGIELRVYGHSTPFLQAVMETVLARGLRTHVKWLGGKTLDEIVGAIDGCDVGIIPNRRSIFTELNTPTRIFEYLSRGKAVIAPATPGIREYFTSDSLVFFELGDADDLAKQLQFVFSNPTAVDEIIRRGQEIYLDHRWTAERNRLLALVAELLRLPGPESSNGPS